MAVVGELVVGILGNTAGLSSALAKSEAELKGFSAAATSHGNVASNALHGVGIAGAAVAVGVAAYLTEATHSAIGFQDAMAQVGVTAHLTSGALDNIGSAIERASIGTTVSSLTMVRALIPVAGELERITGNTLTAADAVNVLTAAESLHVSTATALDASVKAIADILLVYHLRTADAANVASLLYAAHAQLGLGVETVSGALQRLQPRVAGSGVDLATMLAIAREMEPVVGTGQRAILKLGSVLQDFLSPSAGAQKVLSDLHVSLRDASGQFLGFGPAVDRIGDALGGVHSPAQRAADLIAIFGKNANIAAVLLAQGSEGLAANQKALLDQGTAAAGAATRNLDLGQKFAIARATVLTITDAIGGALIPALTGVANVVLPVINQLGAWVSVNPQLASQILLVAGALGAMAYVLTNVGAGMALLLGPMGLLVAGVAVLGLAWANNWGGMREIVASVVAQVGPTVAGIVGFISGIVTALTAAPASANRLREGLVTNLSPVAAIVLQVRDVIVTAFTFISTNVLPALGQAFNWIRVNVLPPLGDAFNGVAGWVRANWPLISSIVTQVAGAVRTAFLVIVNVIQFAWPILVGIGRVVFPIIGTAATILLNVIRAVFQAIGGIWQGAAIAFKAVADGIGAAVRLVGAIIGGLVGVVATVGKAIGDFFGWLFGNANQAHAVLAGLKPGGAAPAIGGKYAGALHPDIIGSLNTAGVNAATLSRSNVPVFQHGGVVGGAGPQLAVVHGGEEVIPAGGRSAPINSVRHIHIEVGGRELLEYIDRELFGSASNFSSGFGASNPVTGA